MSSPCTMLHNAFCRGDRVVDAPMCSGEFLHSSAGYHRRTCIKASKARAKHFRVKKQDKRSGDRSILQPIDTNELNRDSELQSIHESGRFSKEFLKKDVESTNIVKDVNLTSNQTSLNTKREGVLRACIVTCTGIAAAGLFIQQASHLLAEAGWPFPDSTLLFKYHAEPWDYVVTISLVVVVSFSRQLFLQIWQDFSESSNVANKEVLGALRMGDYVIVAVLPGISEELLFRGALLPFFGLDWKGAALSGVIFGLLHLTGGRKFAFSIWAFFVGFLYGLACISTQNVIVPITAHSVNNIVGALLWKLKQGDAD